MYDASQQSFMSRFQGSEISNTTAAHNNNQINQTFIENFKHFFIELANSEKFFQQIVQLFSLFRPINELKIALKSLVKTIQYIQFKESFNIPKLEENIKPLISLYTTNMKDSQSKNYIDEVNKLLFGSKLDKIVRILTSKEIIGSQQEVHFAVGRIYFAAHSRDRSNYNRNSFKQIKYAGRDMIYNIIRHYVVNQQPDKKKTQICSQSDTEKYPIPAFILNYLQLLFMPIYNQFQELFDKYIMASYNADQDRFYSEIFSSTTQHIIPFFQNLPIEFCNFFTQFYQIITENHDYFSDKMNDLFPVKQLFVNRFFLNPHLRQFSLPIKQDKEKDYVQALNWFSKLFYNNAKEDKSYNQNQIFLKLNSIVQDCFQKIVTNYHQSSGHVDVYNLYVVDPVLKKDYNFIYELIGFINFSEHEQKEYTLQKFKQAFTVKKRIEQKQQMEIIREIATPYNENIQQKINDNSPKKNQQQSYQQLQEETHHQANPTGNYQDYQESKNQIPQNQQQIQQQQDYQIQQNNQMYNNPYNQMISHQQSFPNNKGNTPSNNNPNNFMMSNNMNYPNNNMYIRGISHLENNMPKTGENQGMYQQGNYLGVQDNEESEEFLSKQLEMIRLKKIRLEEEQMIIERHRQKMESLKNQSISKTQNVANFFQSYSESLNKRNYEDKIKLEYEKRLTDQFDQMIQNQKNNLEINEQKSAMEEEIILLYQRNEFLKMIMKSRYPSQCDYIDTLDNKENLEQWKKTYELQQKQQERREKRQKRNQEDDEFYYYQNIISKELKKVEEADLKLEVHKKIHVELM